MKLFICTIIYLVLVVGLMSFSLVAIGQGAKPKTDSFFLAKKKGWIGKLGQSISVNAAPIDNNQTLAIKNIDPYIFYKNYIIKSIEIKKVGIGQSINDTGTALKNVFNEVVQLLHTSTSEKTIRNNLFFKENELFIPFRVADNERYLRDLPYLQDVRIKVREDADLEDSVIITILYKDVFPIGVNIQADNANSLLIEGKDENFRGLGDKLTLQSYYDLKRNPKTGFGVEYVKRNIKGSFVDYTLGYQNMNTGFSSSKREEINVYTRLELPLVSPYNLWTGAVEASEHFLSNDYLQDSVFKSDYKYNYNLLDIWGAYNVSTKSSFHASTKRKITQFLGVRWIKKTFFTKPYIYNDVYSAPFADQSSWLGSYTIFKQDYFRTSFIYGFGRTEDIPVGYNLSAIAGWTNRDGFERPYGGIDLQRYYFTNRGCYYNFIIRAKSFLYQGNLQDMGLLMSIESFSKIRRLGHSRWLLRHFINGSFTQQANVFLTDHLQLNSQFGLQDFQNPDSLTSSRLSFSMQSVFFNSWKFFGFKFAPFHYSAASLLKTAGDPFNKIDLFTSIGGGVRTRNENLVLGTIELKITYAPRTVKTMSPWNITLNSDIRFRYTSQYIKRPDFVGLN